MQGFHKPILYKKTQYIQSTIKQIQKDMYLYLIRSQYIKYTALAGVAQWIEHQPMNQGVASLILTIGHMPGRERSRGNHTLMFLSLSSSLPLSKINK